MQLDDLIQRNRQWARASTERDPEFFTRLAQLQKPHFLWIGCADSRVPANDIVGLPPGELFVHRNVANVVVHSDLNCLSVMQFAVDHLKVGHIIVCGHYGCSGVQAALSRKSLGLADNWLRHLHDVVAKHRAELDSLTDDDVRFARLCELNVIEQVANVCQTTIAQSAWNRGQPLTVNGWIYDIRDGLIRDLGLRVAGSDEAPGACTAAADALG